MNLRAAIFQAITEPDNQTVCPVRIMAIVAFIQFSAMSVWHMVHTGIFDVQAEAIGFGAMLAGVGAALGMKKDSK